MVGLRASEVKSEDPGFDPLAAQGEHGEQFFYPSVSTLVQTCLRLTPLHVCGTHPNVCMLKIPYPSVLLSYKSMPHSQWVWKHENTAHRKEEQKLGSTYHTMAARFPRGKQPEFSVHCNIALGQESYLFESKF